MKGYLLPVPGSERDLFDVLRDVFYEVQEFPLECRTRFGEEIEEDLKYLQEVAGLTPAPGTAPEMHEAMYALVRTMIQARRDAASRRNLAELAAAIKAIEGRSFDE